MPSSACGCTPSRSLPHMLLREADDVKSRFLASMSHELRTPLNAILNFTRFVSSGMLGPINAEQPTR
ncbi:MAG: hypothetical protein HND48_23220 [Chloroflexi bacterium]|nr:hypothetical protein [Chloroflexota bacterium]